MMNNNVFQKEPPLFRLRNVMHSVSHFIVSAIIGFAYGLMIVNETTQAYLNSVLPSGDGPDLHQYVPVVVVVLIYSAFIQKKQRNMIEKISFSCLHILVALLSCVFSVVALLMM